MIVYNLIKCLDKRRIGTKLYELWSVCFAFFVEDKETKRRCRLRFFKVDEKIAANLFFFELGAIYSPFVKMLVR